MVHIGPVHPNRVFSKTVISMKILHITNSLSEGGVESFLLQLLSQLVQQRYEVDVLVLNKNKPVLRPEFEKYGLRIFTGPTGRP